jgi:hypothetical protein
MSFLDTMILLPQWILYAGVGILFLVGFLYVFRLADDKKFCTERDILVQSRKKGLPIIQIIDVGSNSAIWELGEKEKKDDISFKSKSQGIRIDPILTQTGCEPMRLGSSCIYSYAYENWLPQTTKNNLAFKSIIDYKNDKCKDLAFLTDVEFTSLISTPENYLEHDVQTYVSKYFKSLKQKDETTGLSKTINIRQYEIEEEDEETCQKDEEGKPILGTGRIVRKLVEEEVEIPEIVKRIENIKNDIAQLPISRGWFSGTEAFKNNAYAYSAQDLEALITIHDKQAMLDILKRINMMLYATAIVAIMIGGAIAFYIIRSGVK